MFYFEGEVWVVGGKLSSPFALNIKPLVLKFALRVRSEEQRVKGKGERAILTCGVAGKVSGE